MANKLKMAHERRKLSLRAMILGNRAKVAGLNEQVKRAREELSSMRPKRTGMLGNLSAVPTVKVR